MDTGATTSPELVAGVIEYLKSEGYKKICILEGLPKLGGHRYRLMYKGFSTLHPRMSS
jgi:uncharacterized protein (DUF362 family)